MDVPRPPLTANPRAWLRHRGDQLRMAGRAEMPAAVAFAKAAGPRGVLIGARIWEKMTSRNMAGEVWIAGARTSLRGVCWFGGTLMPVGFADQDREALAAHAKGRGGGCTSIVGEAGMVLPLWDELAKTWPKPRNILPDQPLLAIDHPPGIAGDAQVRLAFADEAHLVLPASIAMFTEELGFDPPGTPAAYRGRVADLIRREMTYVRIGPIPGERGPRVQFKADLGATLESSAQVHGVWTHPALRGQGVATHGMASVVADALARGFTSVSLYVNSHNAPAMAVYQAVGFQRVSTFATILF